LRHRAFLNREERLACLPVEDKDVALLGANDQSRYGVAITRQRDQRRLHRHVVVPDVMVHRLKVPDRLTGCGPQGDDAVRVEILTDSLTAIVVRAGG
jgi:hypothetical protein